MKSVNYQVWSNNWAGINTVSNLAKNRICFRMSNFITLTRQVTLCQCLTTLAWHNKLNPITVYPSLEKLSSSSKIEDSRNNQKWKLYKMWHKNSTARNSAENSGVRKKLSSRGLNLNRDSLWEGWIEQVVRNTVLWLGQKITGWLETLDYLEEFHFFEKPKKCDFSWWSGLAKS